MKVVLYKESDVQIITNLVNSLKISGFENARMIAKIGEILDSGQIKDQHEPPGGEKK